MGCELKYGRKLSWKLFSNLSVIPPISSNMRGVRPGHWCEGVMTSAPHVTWHHPHITTCHVMSDQTPGAGLGSADLKTLSYLECGERGRGLNTTNFFPLTLNTRLGPLFRAVDGMLRVHCFHTLFIIPWFLRPFEDSSSLCNNILQ